MTTTTDISTIWCCSKVASQTSTSNANKQKWAFSQRHLNNVSWKTGLLCVRIIVSLRCEHSQSWAGRLFRCFCGFLSFYLRFSVAFCLWLVDISSDDFLMWFGIVFFLMQYLRHTFKLASKLCVWCFFWIFGLKYMCARYVYGWINGFLVVPTTHPRLVCFDSGDFTVNSANKEATPCSSAPIFFIYICIYMPLHHKQVKRASGSSWMCGHNTESATSKPPPFSPQRRDESKEGGRRREKIWDKFFSHTPQVCLCSWKNCSTHLWRSIENPSISVSWPLHSCW